MPTPFVCPTCSRPHPSRDARPGALLLCDGCHEVFAACDPPARPAAPPVPGRAVPAGAVERDDADARSPVVPIVLGLSVVLFLLAGIGVGLWVVVDQVGAIARRAGPEPEPESQPRPQLAADPGPPPAPAAAPAKPKGDPPRPKEPVALPARPRPPVAAPRWGEPDFGAALPPFGGPAQPNAPGTSTVGQPLPGTLAPGIGPPKTVAPQVPRPVAVPVPELPNPYKPGTQTRLRELGQVAVNAGCCQLVHSAKHNLLFVRTKGGVEVYDAKAGKHLGTQKAKELFTDMSLAPDESALFAADFGGEVVGYNKPVNPSRLHRFDLATRAWEARTAPKIGWKVEAVDGWRAFLLEQDQWVDVTLNVWERDGEGVKEVARTHSNFTGDIEYDPRTNRLYHGNRELSAPEITVQELADGALKRRGSTGMHGSASKGGGGGTVVLSRDGSRLYTGKLQVAAAEVTKNLVKFPEQIVAASRDVAFGATRYYRAANGDELGGYEFKTAVQHPDYYDPAIAGRAAVAVSSDGLSVWVFDRDKDVARQYALEGEK